MAVGLKQSEEDFKQSIFERFFDKRFKYHPDFGRSRIDMTVTLASDEERHLFWCEAKVHKADKFDMLTQLLLTIQPFENSVDIPPPTYIGCVDPTKLYVTEYKFYKNILGRNDIDWRAASSNYTTESFKKIRGLVEELVNNGIEIREFDLEKDKLEIKDWVQMCFEQQNMSQIEIDLVKVKYVYNKWLDSVKPQIDIKSFYVGMKLTDVEAWKKLREIGVNESDFFLADLYSHEGHTVADGLKILIDEKKYSLRKDMRNMWSATLKFKDSGKAYTAFWNKYKRPPSQATGEEGKSSWFEILYHRELLVPRDVRERKGAFFTPYKWVALAHQYIADAFGQDWQENYWVWDNSCGTLALFDGLYNTDKLFASTIDESDVRICYENVDKKQTALRKENIFQFDFLNDDFKPLSSGGKMPDELFDIISDKEKRKKLIVLMNPPYVEGGNGDNLKVGKGNGSKRGVSDSKVKGKFGKSLGKATNEVFVQFLLRIYDEIKGCWIAEFSKLKTLQSTNFDKMRKYFKASLISCFIVPADTFENVEGDFPIGFKIWDTQTNRKSLGFWEADVYDEKGKYVGSKRLWLSKDGRYINDWASVAVGTYRELGKLMYIANDFQQQKHVELNSVDEKKSRNSAWGVSKAFLPAAGIYFAVRWSVEAIWLNDRDQFFYPQIDPLKDIDFINDCLIFMMFHTNNHVSIEFGDNHWIPFTEVSLNIFKPFTHHTIYDYLIKRNIPQCLSPNALHVYNIGFEIFKYYHSIHEDRWSEDGFREYKYNHNAALYDIRKYFQGTSVTGRMNPKSKDAKYQALIENLRRALNELRDNNIAPKVYQYGFLRK